MRLVRSVAVSLGNDRRYDRYHISIFSDFYYCLVQSSYNGYYHQPSKLMMRVRFPLTLHNGVTVVLLHWRIVVGK